MERLASTEAKMSETKRLFCAKPFKWFEVSQGNETGDVYMCCPSWLDMPIGNLTRQSVEEIWNGEKAQEIRRSILDGRLDIAITPDALICKPYLSRCNTLKMLPTKT